MERRFSQADCSEYLEEGTAIPPEMRIDKHGDRTVYVRMRGEVGDERRGEAGGDSGRVATSGVELNCTSPVV